MKSTRKSSSLGCTLIPARLYAGAAAKNRINRFRKARLALLTALTFVVFACAALPAGAADPGTARPPITLASLEGTWQATLFITGGCGVGTKLVTFFINPNGPALATEKFHTDTCGDNTIIGTFIITSLNASGTGTAQLYMTGVTFNFNIQVAPSGEIFNMVDITDTWNYEEGTAIRQ